MTNIATVFKITRAPKDVQHYPLGNGNYPLSSVYKIFHEKGSLFASIGSYSDPIWGDAVMIDAVKRAQLDAPYAIYFLDQDIARSPVYFLGWLGPVTARGNTYGSTRVLPGFTTRTD